MDYNRETNNKAGLFSLSGFSYQIKAFIYYMTQLKPTEQVGFETMDDVSVRAIPSSEDVTDQCFKWKKEGTGKILIQVKDTNIGIETARKVLYNWILAFVKYGEISKFVLFVAEGHTANVDLFNVQNIEREYKALTQTSKSKVSLPGKLKEIFDGKPEEFGKAFSYVCERFEFKPQKDIEASISDALATPFHAKAVGIEEVCFDNRVKELFSIICSDIMEQASQRKPYICSYEEYMQKCEEICNKITTTDYNPSYNAFKQLYSKNELTEDVLRSREYKQLRYCKLGTQDILTHLMWKEYYQNIRQHRLADARKDLISETEEAAYYNHQDVVAELKNENRDQPRIRLSKTKQCPISTVNNEFSRWGAYVFLTQEDVSNQISWKDDEAGDE